MITIIDYGLGNVRAFENVYRRLGIKTTLAHTAEDLKDATSIILPGVGAFDHAMTLLQKSGMNEKLNDLALEKKIPVLGICVGMQILAKSSDEGNLPGLGWINGVVKKFDTKLVKHKTRLPHMGWNTIIQTKSDKIFENINDNARFYFLHSYYFHCFNRDNEIAETEYGLSFSSAVYSENIYGVQFHPEKSHQNGIQILNNFANLNYALS